MKKLKFVLCMLLLAGCSANNGISNNGTGSNNGSNSNSGKDVAVKDAVDAAYATVLEENKVATIEMDKETVVSFFGLEEDLVKDAYGIGPMMSTHVDMIVAMKATKGNEEKLEDLIETYQENLENDTMQYPMNMAAIAEAEVFSEGDNVYYVRLNTYTSDDLDDEKKAEVIEKIVDKAEKAIEDLH